MAMLRRPEVRVTNVIPVRPDDNRNPTSDEVKFFEHLLVEEVERTKPEIIVPMGYFAVQYFLGYQADVGTTHGMLHRSKRYPGVKILPTFHPAAGLHNSETQSLIAFDFQQLRLAIEDKLPERPVDVFPDPIYIELITALEVRQALDGCNSLLMGQDTEGYAGFPWGLSFSVDEGVAYVIRIQAREALNEFGRWIAKHSEVVVSLHNALHDLPILREMGIDIKNFEDNMVYAYVLCLEPQGLKDLAYRRAGMKMKSYTDVIAPAMRKLTGEYLVKVASGDWGLDPEVPVRESDQTIRYRQPTPLHKRALRAVNDVFGMYTGIIIGDRSGGSARLDEIGVRVGKVDHETVLKLGLKRQLVIQGKKSVKTKNDQNINAWHVEVPIPILPKLEDLYGDFIWELQPPVAPEDPPDPIKRWEAMSEDLEESVARCEAEIGALPVTGLDALEDQEVAIRYSARDADATLRVRKTLRENVEANGMLDLAMLDMSVLPYIDRMRTTGIKINQKHMLDYGDQLAIEMRQIQEKIHKDLGVWINPSSSKQVGLLIYDILGFPVEKWTKTRQPSTDDKVLESLAPLHPNITDVTDFRERHKLRSTYATKLPKWMDSIGRLHTNWKYTRVASGRLSTSDPNVLGIPVKSEMGNKIRAGFIPEEGHVFIGCDLSQIEVRVAAHYSQDPNLVKIFMETGGPDFHTQTAMQMWHLTADEVNADHKKLGGASKRSSAKNVSFGVLYGISATGLQAQLKSKCHTDWTEEECQDMIDRWLSVAYPQVKWYMERQRHFCKVNGYVTSMHGRRRYLPGINSTIHSVREEAYRAAINHPIQASAAEVLKIAERNIWQKVLPAFWEMGCYVEPVLAVHDELIFEVDFAIAKEVEAAVRFEMENAVQLCVPVVAEGHISELGGSWADLK